MHPILIKLGPLTLRWYGLLVAIGFLLAYRLFRTRAAQIGLRETEASNLLILLFATGILGARIYYVVWNWNSQFADNLREIVMVQHGGLVFFGGFLTACVALLIWAGWKKQPLAPLADALSPALALGHAFGRLGCFMNGCCYGRECLFPWAVRPEAPLEVTGLPIHPTQVYESLGLLNIMVTLLVIERIARYPGQVALSYCILYSILRFIVEFFRGDVPHDILGRFTLAQAVSMGILIVAWALSVRLSYRAAKKARAKNRIQGQQAPG